MVSSAFRKIICFFTALIFLLFSVTFPVYATSAGLVISAAIVGISAGVAIPAILGGLGVFPETDTSAFDNLVDSVTASLGPAWLIANEVGGNFIKMLQIGDNYYAQHEMVADILAATFATGFVSEIFSYNGYLLPELSSDYYNPSSGLNAILHYSSSGEFVMYTGTFSTVSVNLPTWDGYTSFYNSDGSSFARYKFELSPDGSFWARSGSMTAGSVHVKTDELLWSNLTHAAPVLAYAATGMAIGSLAESLTDEEYQTWVAEPIIVVADPITSPEDPTKPSEDEDTDISPTVPGSDLETADQHNYLNVFKNNPVSPTWAEYIAAAAAGQLTGQALRELQKQFQEGKTEIQIQDSEIVQTGTQVQVDPSTVPEGVVSGSGSGSGSGNISTDTAIDPSVYTNPIIKALNTLGDNLLNGIKNFFVPSSDFLTEKVEALRSEFEFADSIISSGEEIGAALGGLGGEPPVIYAHLGNAEGSLNWGGTVAILDMSWYSRYKPTVDTLISSLMWLAFSWRCFVKLPGFISGVPGDFVMDIIVDLGMESHLPSRKKEYVLQRRDNRRLKP